MSVLRHYSAPNATWVETGTYLGETTRYLSSFALKVHTIEPSNDLHLLAKKAARASNVEFHLGLSEHILPGLIKDMRGDVNFWLDGHWSAGRTFRGPSDTPIVAELAAIEAQLARFSSVTVFVDDFRCFVNWDNILDYSEYPAPQTLVEWSIGNGLRWTVEHDIFIASNFAR